MSGWDAVHRIRQDRLRMQRAISGHVVAVEVLLDIYGDNPEQLRELLKTELRELMERAGIEDA